jgi:hypothetical protein
MSAKNLKYKINWEDAWREMRQERIRELKVS